MLLRGSPPPLDILRPLSSSCPLRRLHHAALRSEANKAAVVYRERQGAVEGQIMGIDKLNSIINGLEREMLALKKQYEAAVRGAGSRGKQQSGVARMERASRCSLAGCRTAGMPPLFARRRRCIARAAFAHSGLPRVLCFCSG